MTSPSKLKHAYTVSEEEEDEDTVIISTPTKTGPISRAQTEPPPSPTTRRLPPSPSKHDANSFSISATARDQRWSSSSTLSHGDNLSKIPPQLLHSMRESFSVLDSNSTGTITASSVAETLQSLGLQENNISQFFPPGQPPQLSLPQYLNQLANILVGLSPQQELLNAFSAFDDDDSGQIDVVELRKALLDTPPDAGERALTERDVDKAMEGFTGRRILGRSAIGIAGVRGLNSPAPKRGGEVFRYHDFVGNLTGGPAMDAGQVQSARAR